MCSVVGCDSWRRSAQRFRLPEDPERRLEWVQFIFEVNGQRLKEASWTEITVCNEHFTEECFEQLTPASGVTWVQLKPTAVPSRCVTSPCVESVETSDSARPSENSSSTLTASAVSNTSAGSDRLQQEVTDVDLTEERAALLRTGGKYVVNESCLLQLFRRKCPACDRGLQTEKVTCRVLVVLNQRCLQCDYRYQWKSQVDASVPTAEDQRLTEAVELTPETQEETPTDDDPGGGGFSKTVTRSDEDSDPSDEGEAGDGGGGVSSDDEWNPTEEVLLAEELAKESKEESEDEGDEEEEEEDSAGGLKINELCTECGSFFSARKPHTCEHKIKPYSCNICGKRCVTETSLKRHSRIHDETYDHPCKYCYVTFKTRVDKLKHERTHRGKKDPYKCPDCPEKFPTNNKRRIHLEKHRTAKVHKCGVCGIEFKVEHHLRRHSVVHTGLKPYTCAVCQRGFNQASHLKSHMRLHTGERPYKCQRCDESFNHNVSLKSHVQRCHKGKTAERASATGDGEDSGNNKGSDSDSDYVEQQEVQEERTEVQKCNKRNTGRPRGRPKRNAAGGSGLAGRKEGKRSNAKTAKSKAQKTSSSEEEERSDSDTSFDLEEEEEKSRKRTARSRGRQKK